MKAPSTMEQIRHFIWDFDGTLLDTYPIIIENLRLALREFGHDCDPVEAMGLMLNCIGAAQTFYAEKFGIDRADLVAAYERYHRQATQKLLARPYAGVEKVLDQICATGRFNYIFTHRKQGETAAYLEKYGLSRYFRHIVGPGDEGFAVKPSPRAVQYLMEKYGMDPAQTVMVGDRDCDLSSGRNAGICAAHLVCAVVPEELECHWRLTDFAHMLKLL